VNASSKNPQTANACKNCTNAKLGMPTNIYHIYLLFEHIFQ
jgi:hypothetical protein